MNLMDLKYKIRKIHLKQGSLTSKDRQRLDIYRDVLIEYSLEAYQKEDWNRLHEICALLGEIDSLRWISRSRESSSTSGG